MNRDQFSHCVRISRGKSFYPADMYAWLRKNVCDWRYHEENQTHYFWFATESDALFFALRHAQ